MSFIKKVDHITYACAAGTIEKWAWFHIEVEGGTLINRIDDVRPGDPDSSMKIWCIDYGDFGVALIEGIDRAKKSQVTKFVDRHGDHACQHVAYDTHDLEKFQAHMRDADEVHITFAEETGRGFYDQIEDAVAAGDEEPFFDFSKMPAGWQVPAPVR